MKNLQILAVAVSVVMFGFAVSAADVRSESTVVPFREVQSADLPSQEEASCNQWADTVQKADARLFPDSLSQWLARNEAYAVCLHGWDAVAVPYWPSSLDDAHRQLAAMTASRRSAVQDYYTWTAPSYAEPSTPPQFVGR